MKTTLPQRIIDGFLKHTKKNENGCIVWTGRCSKNGYGKARYRNGTGKRIEVTAHRFALEHIKGVELSKGLMALHTCDTPICVNPEHLYAGTAADNARDCRERTYRLYPQLAVRGEKSGRSKLSEENALAIHADEDSYAKIGAKYGVSVSTVASIKGAKTWQYLGLSNVAKWPGVVGGNREVIDSYDQELAGESRRIRKERLQAQLTKLTAELESMN